MFISADKAHYAFKVIKMFSFIASLDLKPLSAQVIFFLISNFDQVTSQPFASLFYVLRISFY